MIKAADRLASTQRVNSTNIDFTCLTCDNRLKRKFTQQLKKHFLKNGLVIKKLRKFISRNRILESISADNHDVNRITLRCHLLLTEEILNLLLKLPQPKNLQAWINTKKVRRFLHDNLKPIQPIQSIPLSGRREFDQKMRNVLEFALQKGWNEDRIALELGESTATVRKMVRKFF